MALRSQKHVATTAAQLFLANDLGNAVMGVWLVVQGTCRDCTMTAWVRQFGFCEAIMV